MKSKVILAVAVVALSIFFIYYLKFSKSGGQGFHNVKPMRERLQITVLSTGVVQPENRLEIKPPIAGRIETVLAKEGKPVKKGQVLAWMSSTERAALLDAARAKGSEELKAWEELYKSTPIIAPLSGTIILRNLEPGQTFSASDAVFVMSNRLTVKAQVDETDIAQIQLKQKAIIVLDAYPGKRIEAQVDQIAFDAKTVNNVTTYTVDVLPYEVPSFMRSGMTANVSFKVIEKEDVLLIPTEAIRVGEGKSFVLIQVPGMGKPQRKIVEIGLSDGKRTEIISGIEDNDVLAVPQVKQNTGKSTQGQSVFPGVPNMRNRRGGH